MLNAAAALVYLIAGAFCARAGFLAGRSAKVAARSQAAWAVCAVFLIALAIWRMLDAESVVEDALRHAVFDGGGYFARDAYQKPLIAGAFMALAAAAVWVFLRERTNGVPLHARSAERAIYGVGALVGLVAIRLISYHGTDALLYSGPHLNRFLEPALVLFVGAQSLLFTRQVRRDTRGQRQGRR